MGGVRGQGRGTRGVRTSGSALPLKRGRTPGMDALHYVTPCDMHQPPTAGPGWGVEGGGARGHVESGTIAHGRYPIVDTPSLIAIANCTTVSSTAGGARYRGNAISNQRVMTFNEGKGLSWALSGPFRVRLGRYHCPYTVVGALTKGLGAEGDGAVAKDWPGRKRGSTGVDCRGSCKAGTHSAASPCCQSWVSQGVVRGGSGK